MPPDSPQLPKAYSPADTEPGVRARWDAANCFHADPRKVLSGEKPPYCILIPPPNVTAPLHLGHALNNTIQDILARAHRMMGFETLWMPGTDHAGIATQAVVERRVFQEEGKRRTDFKGEEGRAEFVARIEAFKDEYEATIIEQLKLMGCSCDWARQRFTMDEQCAAAVREAFFLLFRDGLIYRGKRLVHWDPVLQTAVADDETEDIEIDGQFYYLRYPLVHPHQEGKDPQNEPQPVSWSELARRGYPGAGVHPDEEQAWITVATTRPETYLGDTAVAVNARDPRAKSLRGLCAQLPLVGRMIPIIEDDYVVLAAAMQEDPDEAAKDPKAAFATGFLKVTPAHDLNDYDLYFRHKAEIDSLRGADGGGLVNIFSPDAKISDKHGWSDIGTGGAHIFVGLTREAARKKVIDEFRARGLMEEIKPYRHSVKHSDRTKAAIEPYLSDQWYVKVTDDRMCGAALRALSSDDRSGTGVPPVHLKDQTGGSGTGVPPVRPQANSGTGVPPVRPSSIPSRSTPQYAIPQSLTISERTLPHWQRGGSTYFTTFRLRSGTLNNEERRLVADACLYWHGSRMDVFLATVMPDHVHMLIRPREIEPGRWWPLADLLHSIKSFTSHKINEGRHTTGSIWQDEYFDRLIRSASEFDEKFEYMQMNPVKARLVDAPGDYPFTVRPLSAADGRDARPTFHEQAADNTTLTFHPARYAKTYQTWHENIRDWCISRQLWWGHRVPVWHRRLSAAEWGEQGRPGWTAADSAMMNPDAHAVITRVGSWEPLDWDQHALVHWGDVGEHRGDYDCFICVRADSDDSRRLTLELKAAGFIQDPDVLDTWFSSALWPISTMGWPDPASHNPDLNRGLLEAFNPSSTLCTAREIITLWVSRMVMFNRYFMPEGWPETAPIEPRLSETGEDERNSEAPRPAMARLARASGSSASPASALSTQHSALAPSPPGHGRGPVPFRDVFIHAMIQDGEGRKMSKSLGNGVDPRDIIASHGADAMRFTLCHMTTQTQDVRMPVVADPQTGKNTSPKFDFGRNFCNKLWNAARLTISIFEKSRSADAANTQKHPESSDAFSLIDRWMLSRLGAGLDEINESLAHYQFSNYAQTAYDLLWRDFCDWYVEAIKPTINESPGQRAVLSHVFEAILRILHPIVPFITESIWEHIRTIETQPVEGVLLGPSENGGLLATAGWPVLAPSLRDQIAEDRFERARTLITLIREVRAQQQVLPKRKIILHAPAELVGDLASAGALSYIESLAGLEPVAGQPPAPAAGAPSVALRFESYDLALSSLADQVDAGAEHERRERRIAELGKSIAAMSKRLDNPGYIAKAPPKLVEESRAQLAEAQDELARL